MTLEITTGLKGSRSPDISSRETNHQCDLAQPISAPSTADITFRMVDLDNRTHRIASRRVASRRCTRGSEMRNAGRKLRFSRNFACFRFPDAEKKSTLKFFLFHSLTLFSTLLGLDRQNHPSLLLPDVSSYRSSFSRSRFHVSLSLSLLYFSFSLILPLLSNPISYPSTPIIRTNTYTRTYTYTHTCIHPLHFDSVLVYRSMF